MVPVNFASNLEARATEPPWVSVNVNPIDNSKMLLNVPWQSPKSMSKKFHTNGVRKQNGNEIEIERALLESSRDRQYEPK